MLGHLFEMGAIFIFLMISEMFNFIALMYLNKSGQVSKVALFSTLHATYIIIFGLIKGMYSRFFIIYIVLIYCGYILMFSEKRKQAKSVSRNKRKNKFISKVKDGVEFAIK